MYHKPVKTNYRYVALVERVVDGDTVDLLVDLGFYIHIRERFRLANIDAWEVRGEERVKGLKAKLFLLNEIEGRHITLISGKDKGKYGRWIATIILEDGTNINTELVRLGHATEEEY